MRPTAARAAARPPEAERWPAPLLLPPVAVLEPDAAAFEPVAEPVAEPPWVGVADVAG